MPRTPTPTHDPALLKHAIDGMILLGHPTKEDAFAAVDIAVHNLGEDLGAGAVNGRDAMDIEDDILIMFRGADARQGRVSGGGAVELEATEAVLEVARVGERERFGDLDDEAALDELERLRVLLRVLVLVLRPRHLAQDLDAGLGGVPDDGEEGEADAEGDAEGEGVEDCGGEDEEHEGQFGPAADVDEEFDVVGGFFDEGVGDDGDHG